MVLYYKLATIRIQRSRSQEWRDYLISEPHKQYIRIYQYPNQFIIYRQFLFSKASVIDNFKIKINMLLRLAFLTINERNAVLLPCPLKKILYFRFDIDLED